MHPNRLLASPASAPGLVLRVRRKGYARATFPELLLPLGLQSHARTSAILGDEFDAGGLERGNNCPRCPPLSPEDPSLRLEPLDGWHRNQRRLR